MEFILDGNTYEVVIERKNNKNLYIRVKDDKKIYVTCNYLTTKMTIKHILEENKTSIQKMIEKLDKHSIDSSKIFHLGNIYQVP